MTKDELDLIEFQSHGQDFKAIRFLRADHAAFVERVREIAHAVRHHDDCEAVTMAVHYEDDDKCTCPRGQLLALCEAK